MFSFMICHTMILDRRRRQYFRANIILAIIAFLFLAVSLSVALEPSFEPSDVDEQSFRAVTEDTVKIHDGISFRNDPETLLSQSLDNGFRTPQEASTSVSWLQWLFDFPSGNIKTAVSDARITHRGGSMPKLLDDETEFRGDKENNTTNAKACTMSNGSMGECQLLKRCVMSEPNTENFNVCYNENLDEVCCTKVNKTDTELKEQYEQFVVENANTPEFAKGLPKKSDGKCGVTKVERDLEKTREVENEETDNAETENGADNKAKSARVVNGKTAICGEVPWMVALYYDGRLMCGGTILSERHILTAAHCVEQEWLRPSKFAVYYGSLVAGIGVKLKVKRIYIHPEYTEDQTYNDIALVVLRGKIKFTEYIQPICLPGKNMFGDMMTNITAYVAGFGDTAYQGFSSKYLQIANLNIISNEYCETNYNKIPSARRRLPDGLTKNIICSGYKDGSKDACQGDSGGPLWVRYSGINYLVGIVSFGYKCAEKNFPGIYTSVSYYLDFIHRRMAAS